MARHTLQPPDELVDFFDSPGRLAAEPEALDNGFAAILNRMTPPERISASRHGGFTRRERTVWAARYPEEVPLVNGEFEWLACDLADLD